MMVVTKSLEESAIKETCNHCGVNLMLVKKDIKTKNQYKLRDTEKISDFDTIHTGNGFRIYKNFYKKLEVVKVPKTRYYKCICCGNDNKLSEDCSMYGFISSPPNWSEYMNVVGECDVTYGLSISDIDDEVKIQEQELDIVKKMSLKELKKFYKNKAKEQLEDAIEKN